MGSRFGRKAGSNSPDAEADAFIDELRWSTDGRLGRGKVRLFTKTWTRVDYGDKLPITPELRDLLNLPPHRDVEKRQCLVVNESAAYLSKPGRPAR